MTKPHGVSINRRSILTAATTSVALLSAHSGGFAQSSTPESGEWTFTDDKGVTITLPARPTRIVADVNAAAPLWDFGVKPAALFGWNVMADGTLGEAGGNVDPAGIDIVGDVNEPIRIEPLIAANPDLIITIDTSLENNPDEYWSIDASLLDQVRGVAPIIAITTTGAANEAGPRDAAMNTERFAELAGLLGADVESDDLIAARDEYEAAKNRFAEATSANPDITSLFVATGEDVAWVAWEPAWDDLSLYASMGMSIVELESHEGWWEQISHEQALRYPSDVLFISSRASHTIEQLKESPAWSQHPAIQADQVYYWNQDFIHSYQGMAEALNHTAEALESSDKII